MKFNKMKLAALAMSALMAASTVSPAVYAADLFSDGAAPAEEVFISEEAEPAAEETPVMEEPAPAVEEVPVTEDALVGEEGPSNTEKESEGENKGLSSGVKGNYTSSQWVTENPEGNDDIFDENSVLFLYSETNDSNAVIYYTMSRNNPDAGWVERQATATREVKEADCVSPKSIVLTVTLYGIEYKKIVSQGVALGHHYVDSGEYWDTDVKWPDHVDGGYAYHKLVCDRPGCGSEIQGSREDFEAIGHTWVSTGVYYAYKNDPAKNNASNVKVNEPKGDRSDYLNKLSFDNTASDLDKKVDGSNSFIGLYEVVLENGKPVVVDPSKSGSYYELFVCKTDNYYMLKSQRNSATQYGQLRVEIVKNISTTAGEIQEWLDKDKYTYKDSKVQLMDCTKPGRFIIRYYSNSATEQDMSNFSEDLSKGFLGKDIIDIAPHHAEQVLYAFKSLKDKERCSFSNGVLTNKSCMPISYYKVTYCVNDLTITGHNCDLTTYQYFDPKLCYGVTSKDKVRVKSVEELSIAGDKTKHIWNFTTSAAIAKFGTSTKSYKDDVYPLIYSKSNGELIDSYVTAPEELMTATCTAPGTVTVLYRCKFCKEEAVYKQVINVDKLGHDETAYVRDNIKAATCTSDGSYDMINRCKRCNIELGKKTVTSPKLEHTNKDDTSTNVGGLSNKFDVKQLNIGFKGNVVIDTENELLAKTKIGTVLTSQKIGRPVNEGNRDTDNYSVQPILYTTCKICGANDKVLAYNDQSLDGTHKVVTTLDKLVKEGKSCQPGSITLTSVYYHNGSTEFKVTKTFDYYSSLTAYNGRTAHDPGEVKREVIKAATETATGLEKVTTYCSICGGVIEEKEEVIPALGAKPVKPATPTVKAASAGYDSINVSWSAVTGASGYRLYYRSAGTGVNKWTFIRVITGTSFTHNGLVTGEAYRYTVKAVVNGVQSDYSRTGAVARPMPAAPVVKSVTAVARGNKVTWSKVAGATGYIVMRKTAAGAWTRVATVKSGSRVTWTDKNAVSGASYKVRAYRTVNNVNYKGAFSAAM